MMTKIGIQPTTRPRRFSASLAALVLLLASPAFPEEIDHGPSDIFEAPPEVLAMRIKHLDAEELQQEADRWLAHLKETVRRLNAVKAEVWHENQAMEAAEAAAAGAPEATASQSVKGPAAEIERETELKERSLDRLAALREKRVKVIDRLNVVLDELSAKLGVTDSDAEQEEVLVYRRYVDAVKAVEVDTSDLQAVRSTVSAWLVSPEGGMRTARNVGKLLAIVAGFWVLSLLLSRLAGKAMSLAHGASQILSRFVVKAVRRVTIIVGVLLGLAALEINVTPLVAVIGAAGFVIAFALQNTLSNFASGLMIMLYKPFDVGDFVQTAEVVGTVKSMTLVTTNMLTPDNKLLVVPNNELWGKVITNVTGSSERRVDLVFGIGYGDDIALAERLLREVVEAHPAVLENPEPVIAVSELADSSVNLICRPWVKTPDYWTAFWEITRAVKERFDAEGVSIPFPQRDVHLFNEQPAQT
jgi:small conductance mechanosensitive channel